MATIDDSRAKLVAGQAVRLRNDARKASELLHGWLTLACPDGALRRLVSFVQRGQMRAAVSGAPWRVGYCG